MPIGRSIRKASEVAVQKLRATQKARKKRLSGRIVYDDTKLTSWAAILAESTGYDAKQILDRVLSASIEVRDGRGSHERDGVVFNTPETNWPLIGSIGLSASSGDGNITVLDFGGSLGTAFFQHRKLLERFIGVDWRVVEQDHFVEVGRREMEVEGLSFFHTVQEATKNTRPSVSYIGSSIQYVEEPMKTLQEISSVTGQFLILDRIPLNRDTSRTLRQVVGKHPYDASYPMHVLALAEIKQVISEHWLLMSSYECIGGKNKTIEGLEFEWRGLVFVRRDFLDDSSLFASSR